MFFPVYTKNTLQIFYKVLIKNEFSDIGLKNMCCVSMLVFVSSACFKLELLLNIKLSIFTKTIITNTMGWTYSKWIPIFLNRVPENSYIFTTWRTEKNLEPLKVQIKNWVA